jgi:hypothetical protein
VETAAPQGGLDLAAYLKLFRFPLVFTAIADSVVGYVLMSRGEPDLRIIALLALCSAGLYFFGMAMNDIADRKRDLELAPTRVLPSGRISLRGALVASFLALGLSLGALLVLPGPANRFRFVPWAAAVLFIILYDFLLKLPPTMGLVRACNLLIGVLSGWASFGRTVLQKDALVAGVIALPEFLYVTALTFVSTLEEGTLKRARIWIGVGFMVLAALMTVHWVPACHYGSLDYTVAGNTHVQFVHGTDIVSNLKAYLTFHFRPVVPALLPALALSSWLITRAAKARDRKGVMLLVRDGVAGIVLLDATLVMSGGTILGGFWIALLLLPAFWMISIFKRLA